MKKYYPILVAKKGELVALQRLEQKVKDEICPIIEVVQDTIEKKIKENGIEKTVYRDEFEKFLNGHWNFFNNEIILDFSLIKNIEEQIVQIKGLIVSLLAAGVNIIPTIQPNSSIAYLELVKQLIKDKRLNYCVRNSERGGGFDNFKNNVEDLVAKLETDTSRIVLLLDLGEVKRDNINFWTDRVKVCISSLKQKIKDWNSVVVASGSFPSDLADIQKRHEVEKITRFEWIIWKNIKKDANFYDVKYGDYGTKYPFYEDVSYAGTVSIKYTTENEFVIYKGEMAGEHKHGRGQYILHAQKLIKSVDYSGRYFCWGDMKIYEIAQEQLENLDKKSKPGSPTTWVQISQNHHITLLDSLL